MLDETPRLGDLTRRWRERATEENRNWPASVVGMAYSLCADELEAAMEVAQTEIQARIREDLSQMFPKEGKAVGE